MGQHGTSWPCITRVAAGLSRLAVLLQVWHHDRQHGRQRAHSTSAPAAAVLWWSSTTTFAALPASSLAKPAAWTREVVEPVTPASSKHPAAEPVTAASSTLCHPAWQLAAPCGRRQAPAGSSSSTHSGRKSPQGTQSRCPGGAERRGEKERMRGWDSHFLCGAGSQQGQRATLEWHHIISRLHGASVYRAMAFRAGFQAA